jgi:hypothetical protein
MSYVVPENLIEASKELCKSILAAGGGHSAVANSIGCDRQYVYQWGKQGYVPLAKVYDVATVLNVSEWAVSYHKLMEVFGEKAPELETVLENTPLAAEALVRIREARDSHEGS